MRRSFLVALFVGLSISFGVASGLQTVGTSPMWALAIGFMAAGLFIAVADKGD